MTATFAVHDEHGQVFVYVRGRLVMKRWLRTGASRTFYTEPSRHLGLVPAHLDGPRRLDVERAIQAAMVDPNPSPSTPDRGTSGERGQKD